jgi:predicted nucleotidyltransferase
MPATPAWPPRSAPRLFVEGELATGQSRTLDGNAAHYLGGVMRVAPGDAVILLDDISGEWAAQVEAVARRAVTVALTQRHTNREALARHYLHLGERQRRLHCADGGDVAIKKLFYALRPAAVLRWMLLHPEQSLPPMHFPTLMAQCDAPADCAEIVEDLLAKKAVTRELGTAAVPAAIADFIDSAFNSAAMSFATRGAAVSAEAREDVADFFRAMVDRFG